MNLTDVMHRGHAADFCPIHRVIHDECPEDGTGRWVVLGDGVAGPVGVFLCLLGVAMLAGLRGGRE